MSDSPLDATPLTWLLPLLVLGPVALAAVAAILPTRHRPALGVAGAIAIAATSGVLVAGLIRSERSELEIALAGWDAPLGIVLRADGASAALLAITATVGLAVTAYALGGDEVTGGPIFWPLWLSLWAALNGVYLAGDLFNTYVSLELLTVAAVALVALGGRRSAAPALRYLFVGVAGSLLFVLAVGLVYGQTGVLDYVAAADRVEAGPVLGAVLALTLVGMAAKMALLPLHSWLPVAHPAAPAAVSALLSALVIKAALFVLWRVWFDLGGVAVGTPMRDGLALASAVAGAVAVFWGGLMALRKRRLKEIVAYSTVAQVGYLALVLRLADPGGPDVAAAAGWAGGVLLVLSHGLAKAAMFLAAGTLAYAYGSDHLSGLRGAVTHMPMTVAAVGVAGVSLAGLPPTFGFVAKWQLLVAAIGREDWWVLAVLLLGGLVTFAYTAAMVRATFNPPGAQDVEAPAVRVPLVLAVVPFVLALASVAFGVFSADVVALVARAAPGGDLP
ncbi:formate hydrogenlyase subunit 3/multisubunit Na+/H+ antiporter MnhD subunit [Nocardioides massiliensis]|uniref:Formate hydrogenlyase subunit 3/multisubunit Na+/H+ antiporter MnhD subunit n=3 Tax=Nocardioides massiliensis TaxID=1325935 RepID=A0ABT9NR87_9ACTN|nr:proton-conducting transporter membrane subunit [Nocardioides massiliensis]MDP9822689.1 formate hydrogenlyase subunit 3/multisubunit Na+/H+ antiporter MnhD subunit [Nocardioides massiliensis]